MFLFSRKVAFRSQDIQVLRIFKLSHDLPNL